MNYSEIKTTCERSNEVSRRVIDEFLIYYAAKKEKLEPKMLREIKKYLTAYGEIDTPYMNLFMSEYIAHRIFKKNGLIKKYLNHSEVKLLITEERNFLHFQSEHPWRYSFASIIKNPHPDFYEMKDLFTDEQYLLYSPGMTDTLKDMNPVTWFNLINFNGDCWQTFGNIVPLLSFDSDDIFFFATEVNPDIENDEMLSEEVEKNPWPFFMLLAYCTMPVMLIENYQNKFFQSNDTLVTIPNASFEKYFAVTTRENVTELILTNKKMIAHAPVAYLDNTNNNLIRTAFTWKGFSELSNVLIKLGFKIEPTADIAVSPGMHHATQEILDTNIFLNPYSYLFEGYEDISPEENESINKFMDLILPHINANTSPNLKLIAKQTGMELDIVISLWEMMKSKAEKFQ